MTAKTPEIRPANAEDLPELVELIREHALYEKSAAPDHELAARLHGLVFTESPRLHVLVASLDGELVGYASWSLEVETWHAVEYAHMDCLFLRESARGFGTGENLMRAVARDALAAGALEVQWQTPAWNEGAIRFYRRLANDPLSKLRFSASTAALAHE
ncbi:MAG: GNAT family N-acetyltransferase [Rhodoglobus sp.]